MDNMRFDYIKPSKCQTNVVHLIHYRHIHVIQKGLHLAHRAHGFEQKMSSCFSICHQNLKIYLHSFSFVQFKILANGKTIEFREKQQRADRRKKGREREKS